MVFSWAPNTRVYLGDVDVTDMLARRPASGGPMDAPIYRLPTDRYAQWTPGQRDAARDWLAAHGINHNRVPVGQIITITDDGPGGRRWLNTTVMVTSNGRHVLDPADPHRVLTEPVRVPLTEDPPAALDEWAIRGVAP
jgi:hypothetical protein